MDADEQDAIPCRHLPLAASPSRASFSSSEASERFSDLYGQGRLQQGALLVAVLALVAMRAHGVAFRIATHPLQHWCKPPAIFSNLSVADWKKRRKPVRCRDWDYEDHGVSSIVRRWNLVCQRHWLVSMAGTVDTLGAFVAPPLAGQLADVVGRRPVVLASALCFVLAVVAGQLAGSFNLYLLSTLVASGGSSSAFAVAFVLLFEVTASHYQTLFGTTAIVFGAVIASLLSLALDGLPLLPAQLIGPAPAGCLLLVCAVTLSVESPRWLLAVWKVQEAQLLVLRAADWNRQSREAALQALGKATESMKLQRQNVATCGAATLLDLVASYPLRLRAAIVLGISFSLVLTWQALRLNVGYPEHKLSRRLGLVLFWPVCFLTYQGMTSVGRLRTLCVLMLLLGLACCLLGVLQAVEPRGVASTLLMLANICVSIALVVNLLCVAELFPTVVRSLAFGGAISAGRLGASVAPALASFAHRYSREDLVHVLLGAMAFASTLSMMGLQESFSSRPTNTLRDVEVQSLRKLRRSARMSRGQHSSPRPAMR
ncbi:solute carrier family 22 member 15-like [Dermacentor andersoni]|uniref:solute carrier family 22 member 15-like n=1 Tax=Dermacentor andersoni TaxID=34620 RepID=UPI003B3AC4CE